MRIQDRTCQGATRFPKHRQFMRPVSTKHLPCARPCNRHWDTATVKRPTFLPTRCLHSSWVWATFSTFVYLAFKQPTFSNFVYRPSPITFCRLILDFRVPADKWNWAIAWCHTRGTPAQFGRCRCPHHSLKVRRSLRNRRVYAMGKTCSSH